MDKPLSFGTMCAGGAREHSKEAAMPLSPLAGKLPPPQLLIDPDVLIRDYHEKKPDAMNPQQRVSFGTSGHRGSPADSTFNEDHILAITQAVCEYRKSQSIDGPLFLAKDTHAADQPAMQTALEVLSGNGVQTIIAENDGYTPVPVVSYAILTHNRARKTGLADGLIVTPSHNPPRRRNQIQPAQRWPGRRGCHLLDSESRQRIARRRQGNHQTRSVRARSGRPPRTRKISSGRTSTTWAASSISR